MLVLAQAWVVTGLVVAVVGGEDVTGWMAAVVVTLSARAATGWAGDWCATAAAARIGSHLRTVLVRAVLAGRRGRPGAPVLPRSWPPVA